MQKHLSHDIISFLQAHAINQGPDQHVHSCRDECIIKPLEKMKLLKILISQTKTKIYAVGIQTMLRN